MNIALGRVPPGMVGSFKSRTFPMNTAFQPNTQPTASTLLVAASRIVAASALALGDDHDATVEIVAQGLSKLTAAEVDDFAAHGSDPTFAMQIIDAALTDTETGSDTMATINASTSAKMAA
jgi:hypothetical protein